MTQVRDQLEACRRLLEKAGRLYERHEAGRPDPFNVFSVLRKETDEVHLHSRFLKALLDYRRSPDGPRENLRDFLGRLNLPDLCLDPDRSRVHREFENVDILIRDRTTKHAVVIENKIKAGDRPRQLQNYAERERRRGYHPHLVYLTLHGHATDSAGDFEYLRVSYKEDIRPWLTTCQKRAYDKPTLRESIAQYFELVSRLTGTDHSEEYMKELRELCLRDDNLVLVHDLTEAMVEARVALLSKLWKEIESGISKNICDLPEESKDKEESKITEDEDRIRQFVTYQRNYAYHGLFWKIDDRRHDRWLAIQVQHDPIRFGVCFDREQSQDEWNKLREALDGDGNEQWWPWFRDRTDLNLKNPTREHLRRLASDTERGKYVDEVVTEVHGLWDRIKKAKVAGLI